MYAKSDKLSIKFAWLGFRGQPEANAWLATNVPSHDFGWIFDPHIIMEHVNYGVKEEDTLKRLENIYKLKLVTIAQGLAVSSFENQLPKCFLKTGGHQVIKDDSSYFESIPTYANWDEKDNNGETSSRKSTCLSRRRWKTPFRSNLKQARKYTTWSA
jgi:hypothetical protein